jgi:hypothetical protein
MDTSVVVALIGGTVTALGWLTSHILSEAAGRRRERRADQLAHTQAQLSELYGPLALLITEGQQTFVDLLRGLGRNYVFPASGTLTDDELKTWLFWVDNEFLPRNRRIRELLATKAHLIEGQALSENVVEFLKHYSSWEIKHLRWTREQVPYEWHSSINWPKEFGHDILRTFSLLKQRHANLIEQLTGDSSSRNGSS